MKKFVYSNIDSNNESKVPEGELYTLDNSPVLRQKLQANGVFGQQSMEYLPSILDSSVNDGNDQYRMVVGDRPLNMVTRNNSRLISVVGDFDDDTGRLYFGPNSEFFENIMFNLTGRGIQFSNGDSVVRNPVKWILVADRNQTDTAVGFLDGYNTVNDLLNGYYGVLELLIVARTGTELISTTIPIVSISSFPAKFPLYKGVTEIASFTFNDYTDTTFNITINGADNVKVYIR
jgi:hypothetical protein